eukprot:TRINITY_DN31918_c0_g1_i1.p1 TRINITY_DN31918_c0_g1~~TRINITY_DN31918_c0_g1_i1.p1  ORF type:complete len:739 (+),score=119.37 TRINITY_DN31918_c0_g1_i1:27-2219(+)
MATARPRPSRARPTKAPSLDEEPPWRGALDQPPLPQPPLHPPLPPSRRPSVPPGAQASRPIPKDKQRVRSKRGQDNVQTNLKPKEKHTNSHAERSSRSAPPIPPGRIPVPVSKIPPKADKQPEHRRPPKPEKQPEPAKPDFSQGQRDFFSGTVKHVKETFAFIAPDIGGEDVFLMPAQCEGFEHKLPPVGTRVKFNIRFDSKNGQIKAKAEAVQPFDDTEPSIAQSMTEMAVAWMQSLWSGGSETSEVILGTMHEVREKYGFIMPDNEKERIFVLPSACEAFGGELPPVGTRVRYYRGYDEMWRPRAQNVQKDDGSPVQQPDVEQWSHKDKKRFAGTFDKDEGNFGFIKQDEGGEKLFVLPWSCSCGILPPEGTRVLYSRELDGKTGMTRAEDVALEDEELSPNPLGESMQVGDGCSGTFVKDKVKFGFIRADGYDEQVFVLPSECEGFGGQLPLVGTRVTFTLLEKRGNEKFRASTVHPEDPMQADERFSGTMDKDCGHYGFIKQDDGESLFVLPQSCRDFDGRLPSSGTRVMYSVVTAKTGRRADDVCRKAPSEDVIEDDLGHEEHEVHEELEADEQLGHVQEEEHEEPGPDSGGAGQSSQCKQRYFHAPSEAWRRFCDEHGDGVHDPVEHGAAFLRRFLDELLVRDGEDDNIPEDLKQQVQKACRSAPKAWSAYCVREMDGIHDASKHSVRSLRHFLEDIYVYVQAEVASGEGASAHGGPAAKRQRR